MKKKKLFALIPARKGSKGIKDKNIIRLNKKYLIEHTFDQAKKSKKIDKIFVSSNDDRILKLTRKFKNSAQCLTENLYLFARYGPYTGPLSVIAQGTCCSAMKSSIRDKSPHDPPSGGTTKNQMTINQFQGSHNIQSPTTPTA